MKRYKNCPCGGQPDLSSEPMSCTCGLPMELLEVGETLLERHKKLPQVDPAPSEVWTAIGPGNFQKKRLGLQST